MPTNKGRIKPGGPFIQPQVTADEGPSAPFIPFEFGRPRSARRQSEEIILNLLLTTLAVSTIYVARAPIVSPPLRVERTIEQGVEPNLLTSTLAPQAAGQDPFSFQDWDKPRVRRVLSEVEPNLLTSTLAPVAADTPFQSFDWGSRSTKRILSEVESNLLLTTLSAAPATNPFPAFDWPVYRKQRNPEVFVYNTPDLAAVYNAPVFNVPEDTRKAAKSVLSEVGSNLLTSTLAPAPVQAPFVYDDWIKPRVIQVVQQGVELNLLTSTLAVAAPSPDPFVFLEWKKPREKRVVDHEAKFNFLTFVPAANVTYVPRAVLVTRAPAIVRSVDREVYLNLLTSALTPPAAAVNPFTQLEDQRPARSRYLPQEVTLNLLTSTLFVEAPVQVPFTQLEWQRPAQKKRLVEDAASNFLTSIVVEVQAPFNNLDWAPAKRSVARQTPAEVNLLTSTLYGVAVNVPFSSFDNSTRKRTSQVLIPIEVNLLTSTLGDNTPVDGGPAVAYFIDMTGLV